MGGFLLLAENRSVPYPRSPFSFGHLLHLLYEFARGEPLSLLPSSLAFAVVGILVGVLRPRDRMPKLLVVASLPTSLMELGVALAPPSVFFRGFERFPF